ncbi:MAG: nucleoside deaminase [Acidimicrobiia bacterium]|nr:nucleoside deaminase [Acidimicrobiia bacterium]NNF10373.1 nucleoside deaminase [Acidimicrobiia bacterium]NNL68425.1 nucleoside deaminase [Acidimicrobiia bacterium]
MDDRDFEHLRRAIGVSQLARENGNHPFGATLVNADGAVVTEAENTVTTGSDPTGHAETNLVRKAGALGVDDLSSYTLYSSCEPCAMCSAAIFWAGIGRVVYALSNDELIAMIPPDSDGPALGLTCREVIAAGNRPIAVDGPALEDEAAVPHERFWA